MFAPIILFIFFSPLWGLASPFLVIWIIVQQFKKREARRQAEAKGAATMTARKSAEEAGRAAEEARKVAVEAMRVERAEAKAAFESALATQATEVAEFKAASPEQQNVLIHERRAARSLVTPSLSSVL